MIEFTFNELDFIEAKLEGSGDEELGKEFKWNFINKIRKLKKKIKKVV